MISMQQRSDDEEAVASNGGVDNKANRHLGSKEASVLGVALLILSIGAACLGLALAKGGDEDAATRDAAPPPTTAADDDDDKLQFLVVEVPEEESSREEEGASSDNFALFADPSEDAKDVFLDDPSDESEGASDTLFAPQAVGDVDLFLLAGQSNMIGYTTSLRSITDDDSHWLELKSILETEGPEMEDALFAEIAAANWRKEESDVVAATLSAGVMDLHVAGLLRDIDAPLEFGRCSFLRPSRQGSAGGIAKDYRTANSVPLGWDAGCGRSFGSEFAFGRVLELETNRSSAFEMVKVASPGSRIHKDWSPSHGAFWDDLRRSIRDRNGEGQRWKAFVWHQGETDGTFTRDSNGRIVEDAEDTSLTYLGNLTALVGQVRKEMHDASETGTWECQEQIPAIIVQVGYTPQTEMAERVREAQAQFCREDIRCLLVPTDDLSRFYHFDPASMLVIGHRVAQAYRQALQMDAPCPVARR